jgi:hypothetical protein
VTANFNNRHILQTGNFNHVSPHNTLNRNFLSYHSVGRNGVDEKTEEISALGDLPGITSESTLSTLVTNRLIAHCARLALQQSVHACSNYNSANGRGESNICSRNCPPRPHTTQIYTLTPSHAPTHTHHQLLLRNCSMI